MTRRAAILLGLAALYAACWGAGLAPPPVPPSCNGPSTMNLTPAQAPQDLGERAYRHVARLVGFGARDVGSPGWRKGLDHIFDTLKGMGLKPVRHRWTDPREGIQFENVHVTLAGRLDDRIVIGCHHDTKRTHGHDEEVHNFPFVGANDSGSGVGLLLALAEVLRNQKHEATYQLVFFDGEESLDWEWNDGARALFGSRRFVDRYKEHRRKDAAATPQIRAFILLDMVGARDLQIDEESESTPALINIFRAAAVACGHEDYFFRHRHEVFDDHVPFLAAAIPSIDLIDLYDNPEWHTADDTLDHIAPESLQIVGEVVLTALPAIAFRYVPDAAAPERRDG